MNNGFFEVRRAKPEDAGAILEITKDAFTKYCEMAKIDDIQALHETEDDVRMDILTKTVLVAYIDENVVGSLRLSFDDKTKTAYLSRFGVSGVYRNNGIGKSLVNMADIMAVRRGMKHMRLHTASKVAEIMRFYYSRGFYVEAASNTSGYIRVSMVKDYI